MAGFLENDYTKYHKLLDYIDSYKKATVTHEKGFMDVNRNINIQDIFDNYKNTDMNIMITVYMDDQKWRYYEYSPKAMSQDLYGTVDMWRILLECNEMNHPGEFCKRKKLYVPDPEPFLQHLSKVYYIKSEYLSKIKRIWE